MAPRLRALLVMSVAVGVPLFAVACKDAATPPSASGDVAKAGASAGTSEIVASAKTGDPAVGATSAKPSALTPVLEAPPADPPADLPGKRLSAGECKAIIKTSAAGFGAALAKTKRTCTADTDCIQEAATCLPGCGGTAFAAKDKDAYAKAAAAPLEECKRFWDGSCSAALALPIPSCPRYLPVCEKGACVSKMK